MAYPGKKALTSLAGLLVLAGSRHEGYSNRYKKSDSLSPISRPYPILNFSDEDGRSRSILLKNSFVR
jgi:hypothetical protein